MPASERRFSPPLPASARPPPHTSDSMATPATNERALANALWEAAKAGNTAEARRLLDEGAPVDWKNVADVSVEAVGTLVVEGMGTDATSTMPFSHKIGCCATDRAGKRAGRRP